MLLTSISALLLGSGVFTLRQQLHVTHGVEVILKTSL